MRKSVLSRTMGTRDDEYDYLFKGKLKNKTQKYKSGVVRDGAVWLTGEPGQLFSRLC